SADGQSNGAALKKPIWVRSRPAPVPAPPGAGGCPTISDGPLIPGSPRIRRRHTEFHLPTRLRLGAHWNAPSAPSRGGGDMAGAGQDRLWKPGTGVVLPRFTLGLPTVCRRPS